MKKSVKRVLEAASDRFYCYQWQVLEFKDPEDIHQMRVNGRNLLTYLSLLSDKDEIKKPGFIKVRDPLKAAMSALGQIRDMDVLLEEMEKRSQVMPAVQKKLIHGWMKSIIAERVTLRERLTAELPDNVSAKWKRAMTRWINTKAEVRIEKASIEAKVEKLRKRKNTAIQKISDYTKPDLADEEFLSLIHAGRIAIKKLRYALNILKKLDSVDKGEIEALKTLQDQLGHVQDMRVWAARLQEHNGDDPSVEEVTKKWREEMRDSLASTGLFGSIFIN
jgi:CHAD domain-containing protein